MLAQWIVCLLALTLSALFFYESFFLKTFAGSDPGGPAMVPRILCVLTGALAVYHIVGLVRRLQLRRALRAARQALGTAAGPLSAETLSEGRRVALAMGLSIVYPWLMLKLGFILGTGLFSAALSAMFRVRPPAIAATALTVSIAIYYLFAHVMGVRVPPGQWVDVAQWF